MKGSPKVVEELNKALREELTAINQYFLHAEMCENWGYKKLSEYIKKQSIGEMKHAEALMERILFLDGSPTMKPLELTVGKDVREMLQSDLTLELSAVKDYNAAIQVAVTEKDNGSRDMFVTLLKVPASFCAHASFRSVVARDTISSSWTPERRDPSRPMSKVKVPWLASFRRLSSPT